MPKRDRRCRPNGHPLGWNPAVGLCCFAWVAQRQYLSTLHAFSGFKRPPIGPESCRGSAVSHGLPSANTSPLSRFLAGSKVPKRDRLCRPNGHPLGLNPAGAHGLPSANTSPLSRFLAGSKVPKRDRLCRPNGHPLGLNPAGALPFRMGCPAPIPLHSPGF